MGYGINAVVGIAFQNSFGTAAGVSSAAWLEVVDEGVNLKKGELISQAKRGTFDEAPSYEGLNTVEGPLSIEGRALDLGWLFKAALGPPTTVASGSIYTHTFKPRTSDFDDYSAQNPFTLFKYLSVGSGDAYSDLNAKSMEISVANGQYMMTKIEVTGGQWAQAVVPAGSYYPGNRITWDVTSLSIGGTAIDYASELTIGLDNAIEPKHTLRTSKYPAYIKRNGYRVVSVNGTMRFTSLTEKLAFMNQSERNLTISFRTNPTAIQSGYYETLTVILPAFRYFDFPDNAAEATDLEVSFTGKAKFDTSSLTTMHVTLVNTRATY